MRDAKTALMHILTNDETLTDMLANGAASIHAAWQDVISDLPCITFFDAGTAKTDKANFWDSLYQVDIWGKRTHDLDAIANRIIQITREASFPETIEARIRRPESLRDGFEEKVKRKTLEIRLFTLH